MENNVPANESDALLNEIEIKECDHEFKLINDSFDHDWAGGGTEVIVYWECSECGETKKYKSGDISY